MFFLNWVTSIHVANSEDVQNGAEPLWIPIEFAIEFAMTNPIGATIDPAWVKQYSNLNTVDFFLQVHPKTAQKRGFYGPKMAENGTGSEKLILAILGGVTLGKNGTEISQKHHIEWLEQVPPVRLL